MTTTRHSTCCPIIYQAIRLNNAAVHQIVTGGNKKRAADKLYQALDLVSLARSDTSTNNDKLSPPSSSMSSSSCCLLGRSKRALPTFDAKGDFLFYNFITFSSTGLPKDNKSANNDPRIYAAGILLNIAILYHCKALLVSAGGGGCPQKETALLDAAEESYNFALRRVPTDTSPNSTAAAITIKLAAVNNLSQIRWERGDGPYEATNEALQLLFEQLVKKSTSSSSSFGEDDRGYQLGVHELKGMLLNMNRNTGSY